MQAAWLAPRLEALASEGVCIGTSSWKYPGWLGSIYDAERYQVRGKFSQTRFDAECLEEYARTFPVVGGDFSFYQFPTPMFWRGLFGDSPETLQFGLKVPENLTVHTWPGHARYGTRAGTVNPDFLQASVLDLLFLRRLAPYRERVAVVMFEFGTLSKSAVGTPGAFFERLGDFLGSLPGGFRYGVEIRNPEYLGPDYFRILAHHNVAHVFNAWTRMPELEVQTAMPGAFTADFIVARALLARGRSYEHAVQRFEPYREVQELNTGARTALVELVRRSLRERRPAFLFVNNRLEGNAPGTIEAILRDLEV